ncbi:MAG: prohibitin family protein [Anaerolineae bacterium]|nr:prohibitin family protein [Anaerolineae bacterium]
MGGISSLLGALALLGFLGFLGGVGLVVVSASQGRPVRGGISLAVVGLVVGLVFSVISQGILIVEPTQVAVIFNTLNGELGEPRGPGTHIVVPVLQSATLYPIEQQQYTMSGIPGEGAVQGDDAVRGRTSDGQEVYLDVSVLFGVDPTQANRVHVRWQNRYEGDFVRPTIRGLAREVISRFRADEIFGEQRSAVEDSLQELMRARMEEEGFVLTDLLIRDVTFSQAFTDSIERKQIAEQQAQEAAFRVQEETQRAEQVRAAALGDRDAAISRAQGEAEGIVLKAKAQAEALRLVSEQIAANPSLIQYEYIQNLSDNIQLALVPTNSPFLFDFNSLAASNPDFVAPTVPDTTVIPEIVDPNAPSGG